MEQGDSKVLMAKEHKTLSIKEFIDKYHGGSISSQAVQYCCKYGKVDWIKVKGKIRIILTPHTLRYQPRRKSSI